MNLVLQVYGTDMIMIHSNIACCKIKVNPNKILIILKKKTS